MKALQLAALSALVFVGQGCALLGAAGIKAPSVAGIDPTKLAEWGKESQDYAETLCAPLVKEEVGFDEEHAIGGVVAVQLISNSGHLFLDGLGEKDPAKLNETLKTQPVTLPDSAINDLTAYVSIVGRNLAHYSARPDLPWTFAVIQNDTVNAFSAPGGYVVVTTALLKKITNEAQLAGVLGHEIGHIVHKHSLLKYRDAKHKQCIGANYTSHLVELGGPKSEATDAVAKFAKKFEGKIDLDKEKDAGFIKFIMKVLIGLLQSPNDKDAEFQTDKTGLELVVFAGYDPTEYEKFLTSLGNQGGGIGAGHPSTEDRVAKLKALREGELAPFASGTAKPDTSKTFEALNAKK